MPESLETCLFRAINTIPESRSLRGFGLFIHIFSLLLLITGKETVKGALFYFEVIFAAHIIPHRCNQTFGGVFAGYVRDTATVYYYVYQQVFSAFALRKRFSELLVYAQKIRFALCYGECRRHGAIPRIVDDFKQWVLNYAELYRV